MKEFGIFIASFILTFVAALFGGFILMKFYEWCVVPVGMNFNYVFPTISYGLFVMIDIGVSLLKIKPADNKNKVEWKEALKIALTAVVQKVWLLLLLWIFKLIVL